MNYAKDLIDFIDASPTMYQATQVQKQRLLKAGFQELYFTEIWDLEEGKGYFVTHNDSSILAFRLGKDKKAGFSITGAHTDSPLLKIKPSPLMGAAGLVKLNVEVYGGPLRHTWFDRPLSLAGRVILDGSPLRSSFVMMDRDLLIIPSLAIHMRRDPKEEWNPQKEMLPLFGEGPFKEGDLLNLLAEELQVKKEEILDYDLYCYPREKGCFIGRKEEFISAGRLDNLGMCHAGLCALLESKATNKTQVMANFDNEEVGSMTTQGADSGLLRNLLQKISLAQGLSQEEHLARIYASFMFSCDQAHGVHPNYEEKADPTNRPQLGGGPVIKLSASKSYATDGYGAALCKKLCKEKNIPVQTFVNRSDMKGGSTIGPISEGRSDIRGLDLGIALLGMHSVRELQASRDQELFIDLLKAFFQSTEQF